MFRNASVRVLRLVVFVAGAALCFSHSVSAAPAYSSRPGAPYTVYLNFDGFVFNGNWGGNTSSTPGTTPAYGTNAQIAEVWARTAEKYSAFNVNVTTVDPSGILRSNYASTAAYDAARQTWYDNTARVMHTVIGGNGAWSGGGGVSYVGTTQNAYTGTGNSNGYHTNWVFPGALGNSVKAISEATAHENGHGLRLSHQGDSVREYSSNNSASGSGSYAPIMGNSYGSQRGTWSIGTISTSTTVQNDVARLLTNNQMTLVDSGIGHSFLTATPLPLNNTAINSVLAQGVITPLVGQTPNPLGIDNYTKDYFKFTVGDTGNISLTVSNGGDWLTPGSVSPGFTLRSKLNIFSSSNLLTPVALGIENAATSAVTFNGILAAGDYYAQITSYGGYQSTYDTQRRFYDMGSYVLSGSGFARVVIPEPATIGLLGIGLIGVVIRLRRRK